MSEINTQMSWRVVEAVVEAKKGLSEGMWGRGLGGGSHSGKGVLRR